MLREYKGYGLQTMAKFALSPYITAFAVTPGERDRMTDPWLGSGVYLYITMLPPSTLLI